MKRQLRLAVALLWLGMSSLQAQFNYTFSVQNQTYAALTGTTTLNGTTVWDDEDFSQTLGFSFDINGIPVSSAYLTSSLGYGMLSTSNSASIFSTFLYTNADLWDRANVTGGSTPSSPMSFVMTGTTPNRVMKIEINNAGFYQETDFSTNNDYINMQIWLYETSHVIEFHYGASAIHHDTTYFPEVSGKPFFGFFKNYNVSNGNVTMAYFLKGVASAPVIDSVSVLTSISDGLSTWPSNGTVYRFTPKPSTPTGIASLMALEAVAVYPTLAHNELIVDNNEKETLNYTILALNGAAVDKNGILSNGTNTVDISMLASGVYVIDLHSATGAKRVKFVKQ